MNFLKKFLYIGTFLFVLVFPIKAHASIPDLGFSQYGIQRIHVPEGYFALTPNDVFYPDNFIWDDASATETLQESMKTNDRFLMLLPQTEDSAIMFYFIELEEPRYREDLELLSDELFIDTYFQEREGETILSLTRYDIGGKYCTVKNYFESQKGTFHSEVRFHTTGGGKYYEIVVDQTTYNYRDRTPDECKLFTQLLTDIIASEPNLDSVYFEPVPEVMDFPDFGIYNVKIPAGFSVFTNDGDYVTKKFYCQFRNSFDYIHETFETKPRVARIISDDYKYEIDIKAYPTVSFDTIIQKTDMPDKRFEKTYPKEFADGTQNLTFSKGFYWGKYGAESRFYNKEQDYYYHKYSFSNIVSGKYYDIWYTLNGYSTPISEEVDAIFMDNVENMTIDKFLVPVRGYSFIRTLWNFLMGL